MTIAQQATRQPPKPPMPTRLRSQAESFLVLRRNPLELWGAPAYEIDIAEGAFLGRKQLLLNDPAAIRQVLLSNAENYIRPAATSRVLYPILGDGLFLAEGEAWRHQRRTIAPALAPRTMPILAGHVIDASIAAEASLAALLHRPVDLLPHLQALALQIAGQSMFSLEMSSFGPELRALITQYGLNYAQPGLFDLLMPQAAATPLNRGRARFRVQWLEFLDRLIAARAAQPGESAQPGEPGRARDLFDLLAAATDPESGAGLPHALLRDEISTLILAGHETTAVTLFWSIYLAALYPEAQEAMAEEVAGLAIDGMGAVARLPRTRAHIDEALRLYPPAFLILREAVGDDVIGGHAVTPGTMVTISPWVLHRHRKLWRNPDGFDPGRFLPGAASPDRFAYLPFGAGPRICVGASFALTEAVLVLARLLKRFEIRLCGEGRVMPRAVVTTQPDRVVRFELSPRG